MKLPIIQSKLHVPVVKEEYIRRSTLTRIFKKIPEHKVTILHSGAGYGKSTALALWMSDEKIAGCWYSVSAMDDDVLPFLAYIIEAIRKIYPGFGVELSSYMESMEGYLRDEDLNLLSSLFINEVVRVNKEIILVLDDFHQIEHSCAINSWMEKLLDHYPANLHMVLSARSKPIWNSLIKIKASRQLLEIGKEDLVLTIEEMDLLLTELYDLTLDPHHLASIYKLTEGWVIGLCMLAQQISLQNSLASLSEFTASSLHDLFHYLAAEVFVKQPPMIQQFLEQTSIFQEIDSEIVNRIIGVQNPGKLFEQLKDQNLFLQKMGPQQYRYHALFKEFLENNLHETRPNLYIALHKKSANFFEKREMWEDALYHYKKINDFSAAAALLQKCGGIMIESGKLESLDEQLKSIPEEEMEALYDLWNIKAEIFRYQSQYQAAAACYQRAYQRAEDKQDNIGMSKALEGKAKIFLDTIQPQKAEILLYEAIAKREKSPISSKKEMGNLYQLLAENLLNSGQSSKAEKWLQKAKKLNGFSPDGNLEARLCLRTGRFAEAKKILQLPEKQSSSVPQAHRETELLLSLIEGVSGEGEKAKELAQAGIQQGLYLKAPLVEACGWIRMGHAVQLLNKYELGLAKNCYETALDIMEQMGVSRGKAEPLMGLCILYGINGEFERAMEAGKTALEETEKVSDAWLSGLIILSMGMSCSYNEQLEKALSFFQKAGSVFSKCEDHFGQMLSKFWLVYVFFIEKNDALFKENVDLFLNLVQAYKYEFFFFKRSLFGPRDLQTVIPLLIKCTKINVQKEFAFKLLQDMGMTSFDDHPGYSVRVQTLGHFKLWLGEKEVSEKAWQREKAKELFQLLITQNRLIPKEEITQMLWPDQDKQSAERDFKVALNQLQHVLEPRRKARAAPFFVIREGMSYGLNPIAVIELDTVQMQQCIQNGLHEANLEKAAGLLEKVLELYQGEYLLEQRYVDWCLNKRESMLLYFLRGAEKLAQLNVRRENLDKAIYWCEKILERDRTWEEAYRLLMYCYYRKNNRPQAMKWYQKCTEILADELGVEPMEPTRNMYEMILESENALIRFGSLHD